MAELITGVVSGLVASACFFFFMLIVRPKIKIADKLCKDPENNHIYRIKVVNKSRAILNNLHYSLHYCVDKGDGIKEVEEIPPRKTTLSFIDKYRSFGKCDDYAVRISYDIEKYVLDSNSVLEFSIMANHSLSSTMSCKKKVFRADDIQIGHYETGKSMRIIIVKEKSQNKSEANDYVAI